MESVQGERSDGESTRTPFPLTGAERLPHVFGRGGVYRVMKMQIPFERAVREHGATVLRVCRAVLGRGPDADDAWSETFLAALRAWDGLADDTNVEAWLVRIAQRKAIDVTRARRRRAVPSADTPFSDTVDDNYTDHDVWHEVAKLPERQRLALAYHYLGGLTHVETAEIIGGTPDAVRRAAADGIRTLRRTYAPKAETL